MKMMVIIKRKIIMKIKKNLIIKYALKQVNLLIIY